MSVSGVCCFAHTDILCLRLDQFDFELFTVELRLQLFAQLHNLGRGRRSENCFAYRTDDAIMGRLGSFGKLGHWVAPVRSDERNLATNMLLVNK